MKENKVTYGIIHCLAGPNKPVSKKMLHEMHFVQRKWDKFGYSLVIQPEGGVLVLTDFDLDHLKENDELTWGAVGRNYDSIHIAVTGGIEKIDGIWLGKNTLTDAQIMSLGSLMLIMNQVFPIMFAGHNQFAMKECPSFYVPALADAVSLAALTVLDTNLYDIRCFRRATVLSGMNHPRYAVNCKDIMNPNLMYGILDKFLKFKQKFLDGGEPYQHLKMSELLKACDFHVTFQ